MVQLHNNTNKNYIYVKKQLLSKQLLQQQLNQLWREKSTMLPQENPDRPVEL